MNDTMTALLLSVLPALRAWDPRPSAPSTTLLSESLRGGPTATTVRGPGPRSGAKNPIFSDIIVGFTSTVHRSEGQRDTAADSLALHQRRLAAASSPAQPSASAPSPSAAELPSSIVVSIPSSARGWLRHGSLLSGVPNLHEHQTDVLLRSHLRAQAGLPLPPRLAASPSTHALPSFPTQPAPNAAPSPHRAGALAGPNAGLRLAACGRAPRGRGRWIPAC